MASTYFHRRFLAISPVRITRSVSFSLGTVLGVCCRMVSKSRLFFLDLRLATADRLRSPRYPPRRGFVIATSTLPPPPPKPPPDSLNGNSFSHWFPLLASGSWTVQAQDVKAPVFRCEFLSRLPHALELVKGLERIASYKSFFLRATFFLAGASCWWLKTLSCVSWSSLPK